MQEWIKEHFKQQSLNQGVPVLFEKKDVEIFGILEIGFQKGLGFTQRIG